MQFNIVRSLIYGALGVERGMTKWRCPRCGVWVKEPIAKVCKICIVMKVAKTIDA